MLGKLIKHEFKATSRIFLSLYAVVLVVTVILKGVLEFQDIFNVNNAVLSMLTGVTIFAFVLGIIAILLGSFVLVIKRFYDNMLKDEGYLSFTLPVSVGQHIASKSIVGYIWMIFAVVVVLLLFGILELGHNEMINGLQDAITELIDLMRAEGMTKFLIETAIILVLGGYANIALGYACFSIGQTFGKNKILGAFVAYVGMYFVTQIISSIAMIIIYGSNMKTLDNAQPGSAIFESAMIFSIVLTIIQIIAYLIITHVMLNKKLNLQ